MAKRRKIRKKVRKKTKHIKLNKNFTYALAVVGVFLTVKGLEGMSGGATGAVTGAAQTDVTLVGFVSFFVGAFLAIFAVNQIAKHKKKK